jgi:hypothetical protein
MLINLIEQKKETKPEKRYYASYLKVVPSANQAGLFAATIITSK